MNPKKPILAFVADRGGHLHDAMRLVAQMRVTPAYVLTTNGPDVDFLKTSPSLQGTKLLTFCQAFSWWGKKRFWNPLGFLKLVGLSLRYALQTRPDVVISTGASNVVFYCFFAKLLGARLIHVENLAQVTNPSITGKILYPIADDFFVQWEDLLKRYGKRARYAGSIV